MKKKFNTTGLCVPEKYYMVDLIDRLARIKTMVDDGKNFVINRARQYGKTTTLFALSRSLCDKTVDYLGAQYVIEMKIRRGPRYKVVHS